MVLKKEITVQIKDILKKNPQGLSITEIVRQAGINRNTAGRYPEILLVPWQCINTVLKITHWKCSRKMNVTGGCETVPGAPLLV